MRDRRSIRGVIFDWDGTLLDSYRADSHAFLRMFHALGIPWTLDDLARHYAPDWYRVYRAAGLPRQQWDRADRLWARFYRAQRPRLVPGARGVLGVLGRSFQLGLVTSGNRARVVRQLREFRLTRKFGARVYSEDSRRRKPHPAPLRLALSKMGLRPRDCVYVGDAPADVEMARRAGMEAVAVLGSFPTHDGLRAAHPELMLDSLQQLPGALLPRATNLD